MQIHQLQINKKKTQKRVGRGGKCGTYSGRGIKGQKSRAGYKLQPQTKDVIKKYHKLRGYRFQSKKDNIVIVNLALLEKHFKDNETVNVKDLLKKGIISKINNKMPKVKILGKGKLSKKLLFGGDIIMSEAVRKKLKEIK